MPELPDITVYQEALRRFVQGQRLLKIRLKSPFLLRTAEPPITDAEQKQVVDVLRIGKRLVLSLESDLYLVLHLMIAGRLLWKPPRFELTTKIQLAAFEFESGTLVFTEAGSKKRASLHLVQGEAALRAHDPGGIDVMICTEESFHAQLQRENHTIKRSLTDPHLFSGIGNAYSDEILHRARMSPLQLTQKIDRLQSQKLLQACRDVFTEWIERLRKEAGSGFPTKVTAFRPEMAVHGKFEQPCPVCGTRVHRIRYADNETNYCPKCQTGSRILADRALSRLLKEDYPRTLEE